MIVFQDEVSEWMDKTFSQEVKLNHTERNNRFIEEALELVQACGYNKEQVLNIVNYVFDRPRGEIKQEVGGIMVTLAALCNIRDISIEDAAFDELNRISHPEVIKKIREKQLSKINDKVADDI